MFAWDLKDTPNGLLPSISDAVTTFAAGPTSPWGTNYMDNHHHLPLIHGFDPPPFANDTDTKVAYCRQQGVRPLKRMSVAAEQAQGRAHQEWVVRCHEHNRLATGHRTTHTLDGGRHGHCREARGVWWKWCMRFHLVIFFRSLSMIGYNLETSLVSESTTTGASSSLVINL